MAKQGEVVTPSAGALARQEFGATQLEVRSETASAAMAAYAQATVQARYIMAERRPRDVERARKRTLESCRRARFADEAIYLKPVGKGIEGPSIRLAEELVRQLGNIDVSVTTILDDETKRMLSIVATDLESNATYADTAVVEKTVERHNPDGYEVISQRTNKYGKTVFIVRATEDDLLNKQNALTSKRIRSATLRLVPADILEEALEQCRLTLEAETLNDLPGVRKRAMGGFASLKPPVSADDLSKYLGKDINTATALEVLDLRKLYAAIRDGEATWKDALEAKLGRQKPEAPTAPQAPASTPAATASPEAKEKQPPEPTQAAQPTASEPATGFDPVTGVVEEPKGDDPDSFTDGLIAEMRAATDLKSLTKLAEKAQQVPKDRQQEVMKLYSEAKAALRAKATKGGGA